MRKEHAWHLLRGSPHSRKPQQPVSWEPEAPWNLRPDPPVPKFGRKEEDRKEEGRKPPGGKEGTK